MFLVYSLPSVVRGAETLVGVGCIEGFPLLSSLQVVMSQKGAEHILWSTNYYCRSRTVGSKRRPKYGHSAIGRHTCTQVMNARPTERKTSL